MRLLIDTHLLLWAAAEPDRLPDPARETMSDPAAQLFFSAASIWEVAIKFARGRPDFTFDPSVVRAGLVAAGYVELPIKSVHCAATATLPAIHTDPFDRILVAQAIVEGITLLTHDKILAQYPAPVRVV